MMPAPRPAPRATGLIRRRSGYVCASMPAVNSESLWTSTPDWYRDAVIYELHVRAFMRQRRRRHRRLPRPDSASSTTCTTSASRRSGCCRSTRRRCATTATTSPTTAASTRRTASLRDVGRLLREAHERGLRVITELVLNHTSDQHPWFQRARRAPAGQPLARLLRVERHARAVPRRPDHLQGLRDVELDLGPGRRRVLLAPLLLPPARPQLRQPRGPPGACSAWSTTGSRWASTACASTPCPYLFEREGTNCENLPETHAFLRELRAHVDEHFPNRMLLAEANQWPEDAVAYFGDGRRVPHGVPLPADAAAVHGDADGGPLPDHRHPPADAGASRTAASGRSSCATTTS